MTYQNATPEYRCPCRWCQHIREQNAAADMKDQK